MSLKINRRGFLLSLIALGASYVLPTDATPEQVEKVWQAANKAPWHFEVNEWGTIVDPDFTEARTWGEVFERVWVEGIHDWKDVIREVECCQPLMSRFQVLASDEADRLEDRGERVVAVGAGGALAFSTAWEACSLLSSLTSQNTAKPTITAPRTSPNRPPSTPPRPTPPV